MNLDTPAGTLTPADLHRRRQYNGPPGVIEAKSIRVVAVRGDGPTHDWAAYWLSFNQLEAAGFSIDDSLHQGAADQYIAQRGYKLSEETAKLQMLPSISGPYRE